MTKSSSLMFTGKLILLIERDTAFKISKLSTLLPGPSLFRPISQGKSPESEVEEKVYTNY